MTDRRCDARSTDPHFCRGKRDDNWTCGLGYGHEGPHRLYTADGEYPLPALLSSWVERKARPLPEAR